MNDERVRARLAGMFPAKDPDRAFVARLEQRLRSEPQTEGAAPFLRKCWVDDSTAVASPVELDEADRARVKARLDDLIDGPTQDRAWQG